MPRTLTGTRTSEFSGRLPGADQAGAADGLAANLEAWQRASPRLYNARCWASSNSAISTEHVT